MTGAARSAASGRDRRRFASTPSCTVACVVLAVACSSDGGGDSQDAGRDAADAASDGDASTPERGATDAAMPQDAAATQQGDADTQVGAFTIELVAAVEGSAGGAETPAFVSVVGRVHDGETPQQVLWVPLMEGSGCTVLEPTVPFCDPTCGSGQACAGEDDCRDYPTAVNVGTVTLTGLAAEDGAQELTMEPLPPSNTYQPRTDVTLRYPPFIPGDPVRLQAEGGSGAAFDIDTVGIAPLILTTTGPVRFAEDEAVHVEWEAGEEPTARIRVVVDISHHGGQRGEIDCHVADTGSMEIPAELVTQLLELGWSGFPTLRISRETVGSTVIAAGRVDLVVSSAEVLPIDIPGLTSCNDVGAAEGCPDGQTCQADLQCQ
ncbi:MAG: hypothetical protein OXT09_07900 [Myxococcales bacterium]|nr:hypothetical protein [Myxococcales bacterium]